MSTVHPELSIIIPTLNESFELQSLFSNLAKQEKSIFEVIVCDGGSGDGTLDLAVNLAPVQPFSVKIVRSPAGRGNQMNQGADVASAELLLFLHADSRFTDNQALFKAVTAFEGQLNDHGSPLRAARFKLNFRRSQEEASLAYFFYESKARLNRVDCIRGDQGFMITSSFFHQLGGFNTSLPYLEDIRLATLVQQRATWQLLPVEISTSARRFEMEGLCQRQILNAVIVNNLVVGWTEFFDEHGIYCSHASTGKLLLHPLLEGIRIRLAERPASWRLKFWLGTGKHVSSNIWQLLFWLDVRRDFRRGKDAGVVAPLWLAFYQRYFESLTRNPVMSVITAIAVWIWFRVLLVKSRISELS
ncbi:MAG TPA: TIGR04283 family arsenosugar biosynthesis glycosyltransferase [Desulfuromonadaceae bacterium]|jgi:rSAM/selenodomain-associated transferase 2